ncbi:MAG: lipoprotein [Xanthomonadales bacterium]|jgi:predicted small lipoprotein YifL|nr:lipoprotein [Xanthomonadales bacterium]
MNRQPSRARHQPRPRRVYALWCLLLALLVTACGNRGPLYLPDAEQAASPAPVETTETSAASDVMENEDDEDEKRRGEPGG